jgi:sarcosine oxidase subunit beta
MAVTDSYDAVVVGGGVVGASVLFHLAQLGCTNSLLIERGQIAGGGTGKSCGVVRTHYSVLSNTELAVRSLGMLKDFRALLDDPDADAGFVNSGYLVLGDEGPTAELLTENLQRQRERGANTYLIEPEDALELHPLLDLSGVAAVGYEPESGYADPHLTTTGFISAAVRHGAQVRQGTEVTDLVVDRDRVRGVRTPAGDIDAGLVVVAVGPWTARLADPLGIHVPITNYRHTVLTLRADQVYRRDLPIVKDMTVENKMYLRPASGMVLVGTGDSGTRVEDPDNMSGEPDEDLVAVQAEQVARRLPSFADAQVTGVWFGPYDATPDWNPVIDAAPNILGLYLAGGFSGHGFKLAPIVGKLLAQLALGEPRDVDLTPYRYSRFAEGAQLVGAYGIGSIS